MEKIKFASMKMPVVEGIVGGMFRFNNLEDAIARLDTIRNGYIISKNQPDTNKDSSLMLWIRGFDISADEAKAGFLGNYGLMSCVTCEDDKYTISVTKIESELKYHPQRKRPKNKHPNWGHPILRAVNRKKIYGSFDDAQAELQALHEEYPNVSIPCTGKLYCIVYSKTSKPPAQKYVFTIEVAENGGFYIDSEINTYKPAKELPGAKPESDDEPVAGGYFSSMVELKRKKKVRFVPPEEGEESEAATDEDSAEDKSEESDF